ncbi:hypothetical protein BABA_03899 [Neobacillus bataviensis LMG 21833]|uniref:Uncharacterized protein n=1 Tax=Neobacillus bataviensis LMG 21833 TaxID=1117379 RepID=K6DRX5_9BACI|nr:hypothetical protein BABA_03899 [Neobacillus bataviensis LMG 21833]
MVPYRNGENFAKNIQGAELFTVPGAGHIFFTEATEIVNNKVIQFYAIRKQSREDIPGFFLYLKSERQTAPISLNYDVYDIFSSRNN